MGGGVEAVVAHDGVDDRRHAGRPGQRLEQLGARGAVDDRLRGADVLGEGGGGRTDVGREARPGHLPARHGVGQPLAQLVEACPARDGRREHGRPGHAVALHQPHEIGTTPVHVLGGEPVDLVEHDHRHRLVGGEGRDVVVVEPGVGVLLRVGDPDEEVDELEDPLRLDPVLRLAGVHVREVEEDEPVEAADVLPGSVALDEVAGADAEPVEELAGRLAAPDRRGGGRGRRPAHPDPRDLGADERVEERRLAAAGGAGEGHDRVPAEERGALTDLRDDLPGPGGPGRRQLRSPGGDGGGQGVGGGGQAFRGDDGPPGGAHDEGAHRLTRRSPAAAASSRSAWSAGAAWAASASV